MQGNALTAGAWDAMDSAQREQHMKDIVMPRLATVFQKHEPENYAQVDCSLCHPTGAKSGDFAMPDPGLPKFPSYEAIEASMPEVLPFMEEVETEMARALGVPVYDPVTHKGFKCSSCHVLGS